MIRPLYILAIDTSCDDTSAAVLKDTHVLSNVISSQYELHKEWGGVVPIVAKRAHQEKIGMVVQEALRKAKVSLQDVEVVAVTQGPGLAIALEVGILYAKQLAETGKKKLVAVNHMEGHLLANFADLDPNLDKSFSMVQFPAVGLLVSGGHTELIQMDAIGKYSVLGQTLDDAAGEAYDKVARALGLGYPGGAMLAKMAEQGNPKLFPLPVPMVRQRNCNFSFSGLKAAVMRLLEAQAKVGKTLHRKDVCDIAASFQDVVIKHLVQRTSYAIELTEAKTLLLGGGVAANVVLRRALRSLCTKQHISLLYPKVKNMCMDNAAMIGVAAYYKVQRGLFVQPNESFERNPVLQWGEA